MPQKELKLIFSFSLIASTLSLLEFFGVGDSDTCFGVVQLICADDEVHRQRNNKFEVDFMLILTLYNILA